MAIVQRAAHTTLFLRTTTVTYFNISSSREREVPVHATQALWLCYHDGIFDVISRFKSEFKYYRYRDPHGIFNGENYMEQILKIV